MVLSIASNPGPDHHTPITMLCYWYDHLFIKCYISFTSVMALKPSKKLNFCLIGQQNIFSKLLCIVIFGQQWCFPWKSAMDVIFSQSITNCWIMITDLNWGNWGLQFFRYCSGFFRDPLHESSMSSWSNFCRPATCGKIYQCSRFSPFVDNSSRHGSPKT